jgi:hypothetical protein
VARAPACPACDADSSCTTTGDPGAKAAASWARTAAATGLPTTDAVRYGTKAILDAILAD